LYEDRCSVRRVTDPVKKAWKRDVLQRLSSGKHRSCSGTSACELTGLCIALLARDEPLEILDEGNSHQE